MGRDYTRQELLIDAAAAAYKLHEVSGRGDLRRFTDDDVFRYAVAYPWLRLAEPTCQLVTRKLVGGEAQMSWNGMCRLGNILVYDRDEDINYRYLWAGLSTTLVVVGAQSDQLLASS
jgi:uncharacterized protein with HEPN domain